MKTYKQAQFRKVLQKQLEGEGETVAEATTAKVGKARPARKVSIKRDNCDLLIYLIYVNYMSELVKQAGSTDTGGAGDEGEITQFRLDRAHEQLLKKYRG